MPGVAESELAARYARAAAETPVRALARQPTAAVEGAWIDARHFFFARGEPEPQSGLIADAPVVWDADTGEVSRPMEREALRALAAPEASEADWLGARYAMPSRDRLAVEVGARRVLLDLTAGKMLEEPSTDPPELHSPDGRWAVRLAGDDLDLRDRGDGGLRRLTHDGAPHYAYGRQPENDTGPVGYRRRPYPVGRWSDDSAWFLTHRIDERDSPETGIVQHAPPQGGPPVVHRFRLAAVGDPLPTLHLVAIHAASGRTVVSAPMEMQTFSPLAAGAVWFCGAGRFAHVRLDRFRRSAELVLWELKTGEERVAVREETATGFLQPHPTIGGQPNVRVLSSGEALWWSERDGWGHLYLYGPDGALKRQVTQGAWQVRDIVHLDEARRRLLFTAGGMDPDADPALRRLCAVSLDGGEPEVLLAHAGDVVAFAEPNGGGGQDRPWLPAPGPPAVSPCGRFVVARLASLTGGAETIGLDLETGARVTLASSPPPRDRARPFTTLAADGETPLFGALVLPSDFDEGRRYPLLDLIYPGPQQPHLPRGPGSRLEAQARALAELGFVVLMTDTRHMPLRSRAAHQAGYGGQWEPQLADQVAVIDQLCRRHPFIDRSRVGMAGISGGGAATALALFTYPQVFHAGVSVCGNHDSRFYRSIWMDNYVGPQPPEALAAQANGAHVAGLEGALMLVHGDMDDNVPLAQTLGLADALIAADKDFELLVVPNEGHLVLLNSGYAQRRVWDFLARTLLDEAPPKGFALRYTPEEKAAYARAVARELAG